MTTNHARSAPKRSGVETALSYLIRGTRRIRPYDLASLILNLAERQGIDLLSLAYTQRGILKYRTLEESGEAHFIERVLKTLIPDHPILFDVGANCGTYSEHLRHRFPDARIIAFEPNPETFATLIEHLSNGQIECVNLGLGSEIGHLELFLTSSNRQTSHASIYQAVMSDMHAYNDVEEVRIELTTIDQYCSLNSIDRIDFLKVDTEGHEFAVLQGAQGLLKNGRIGCIQFEFNEMNVISRVWLRDFFDILDGFTLFRLDTSRLLRLEPYTPRDEIFQFQNIVAIPKDKASSIELL